MKVGSWLSSLKNSLKADLGRPARRQASSKATFAASPAERLEERTLLSVTSVFDVDSGELAISTATDETSDDIAVTVSEGNVLVNDTDIGVLAADVVSIVISGSYGGQNINLSSVGPADFTALTSVEIDGAGGRDIIMGSRIGDHIDGGPGADVINGRRGDDTIYGGTENDKIFGGGGKDLLYGGDGKDFVNGQGGSDTIAGEAGNDRLRGGRGNDVLGGGGGSDTVIGGSGDDGLAGGNGNDVLKGGQGQDSLVGGVGHDLLRGGNSPDILLGQEDNDNLNGEGGTDTLAGGDGEDIIKDNRGSDVVDEAFDLDDADYVSDHYPDADFSWLDLV